MKIYLLDGFPLDHYKTHPLYQSLTNLFQQKNPVVEVLHTAEENLPYCCGSFSCWVKTPGECVMPACRSIAQNLVSSDLLVFFTPIVFGGYPARLKRAVDHIIPAITPFFLQKHGETHHVKRYKTYPSFLSIGVLPEPDSKQEIVFHKLFERNCRNFYPPRSSNRIFYEQQDPIQQKNELTLALQEVGFTLEAAI